MSSPIRLRRAALSSALALATAMLAAAPVGAKGKAPASVNELLSAVNIPHEDFTLPNGLRVIVHTDRKAPVVAVSVWYRVGSKHEPAGKTGFAHLFEHLMFNGSENAPGDFFEPLKQIGATDLNGTTNPDRTNYFETVPTGALDVALWLESDRMGHLLGAVTQEKLDNQRGVVQNEKRQGDNQPFGLLRYEVFENLFPKGSPYRHSTIGSMGDLNSASLDDVKGWFTANYGPNNAVLVLAGDVDAATARPMVEKWFGDIARGPEVAARAGQPAALPAPLAKVIKDKVPTTRIYRMWTVPGMEDAEATSMMIASRVLGGLSSSRLDNALVRGEAVAVSVGSFVWQLEDAGVFMVQADVKDGVDPALVARRLDEEIARFIASGPTADELQRVGATVAAGEIGGYESVGGFGGKATALASGALFADNPDFYKVELQRLAAATPDSVKAAATKWLSRPVFSLTVEPGERTEGGEHRGGAVVAAMGKTTPMPLDHYVTPGGDAATTGITSMAADRSSMPAVGALKNLDFPAIERTRLKNGIELIFARRAAVPMVSVLAEFDAGYAADAKDALGTQALMQAVMQEGTTTRDSRALAEAQERLGADIGASADFDTTNFTLTTPRANLGAAIDLLADVVRNPAFDGKELDRVRAQQLNRIQSELNSPQGIAYRVMYGTIYGPDHPYGRAPSGLGSADVVRATGRDDLTRAHAMWVRPDTARIYVVGDTTLAEAKRALDAAFGKWRAPATAKGAKALNVAVPTARPRILLVNRPKSPQSVVVAGRVTSLTGAGDNDAVQAANDIFGGDFLSRFNMNLRETKGWSYGVRSSLPTRAGAMPFLVNAPVQADKTGPAIVELQHDLKAYLSDKGTMAAERDRTVTGNTRELPGSFETSDSVMGGLRSIVRYGRPDTYYEDLAQKYAAMTPTSIDAAARGAMAVDDLVYVVVGDAGVVRPQLDALGLPVETVNPDGTPAK